MASRKDVKVWVKFETGRSVGVVVPHNAVIDDIVKCALTQEKMDIAPHLVSVEFEGNEVRRGALVSQYVTRAKNPLLLRTEGNTTFSVTYLML